MTHWSAPENHNVLSKVNPNHCSFLKEKFKKFSFTGEFADTMIGFGSTEKDELRVHSLVLSLFSRDKMKPLDFSLFLLQDIRVARCLVDLLYTGEILVPKEIIDCFEKFVGRLTASCNISVECERERSERGIFYWTLGHGEMFSRHLWEMRNQIPDGCDLKLVVNRDGEMGSTLCLAHLPVIAACSPELARIHGSRLQSDSGLILLLENVNKTHAENIVEFCYKGVIDANGSNEVARIARLLGLDTQFPDVFDSRSSEQINGSVAVRGPPEILPPFSELSNDRDTCLCYFWHWGKCLVVHRVVVETYCRNIAKMLEALGQTSDDLAVVVDSFDYEELKLVFDCIYNIGATTDIAGNELLIRSELLNWMGLNTEMENGKIAAKRETSEETLIELPTMNTIILTLAHPKQEQEWRNDGETFTCMQCEARFRSYREYKGHGKTHTVPQIHKCDTCGKVFLKKINHERHTSLLRPPDFECVQKYSVKNYLAEHSRNHTGEKPYQCTLCAKKFTGRTGLNHHAKLHDKSNSVLFVCDVCGKPFTRQGLWGHMKTHKKEHACLVCDRLFATPSALKRHIRWVHEEHPALKCEFCDREYHFKSQLDRHTVNEHNYLNGSFIRRKAYACERCSQSFQSRNRLESHIQSKHLTKESVPCTVCGKVLSGNSAVKYHMRTHTGERPHQCQHCSKSFTRPDLLKKHTRIHTGERFLCPICTKSFTSKHYLTEHSWTHSATTTISLNTQLPIILAENPTVAVDLVGQLDFFDCKICSLSFLSPELLAEHKRYNRCSTITSTETTFYLLDHEH